MTLRAALISDTLALSETPAKAAEPWDQCIDCMQCLFTTQLTLVQMIMPVIKAILDSAAGSIEPST